MEAQQPSSPLAASMPYTRAEVDSSRPFRSVKEAVAIFGEQLTCSRPIYSLPPPPPPPLLLPKLIDYIPSSPPLYISAMQTIRDGGDEIMTFLNASKKLEIELEETKLELVLLKERVSETEEAVAALTAQLQKSLSMAAENQPISCAIEDQDQLPNRIQSDRWREEKMIRDLEYDYLPSLGQAFSHGEMEYGLSGRRRRRKMKAAKRKPIIPLIGDLFSKKKGSKDSSSFYSQSLYSVIS